MKLRRISPRHILATIGTVVLAATGVLSATLLVPDGNTGTTAGTTIHLTDTTWTCNQPVSAYGTPPVKVVVDFTQSLQTRQAVRLDRGCVGDGDPNTTDLILEVNGDGTLGTYGTAIRVTNASPGASDLVIEGHADCGKADTVEHQDGIQAIGGTNITWKDFVVGTDGRPTCQGAGGAMFYSGSGAVAPTNMRVEGGVYTACNHGLLDGAGQSTLPTGHVQDATFRTGYEPGDTICTDSSGRFYNTSNPCVTTNTEVTESNLVCDRYPFETQPPPTTTEPPPTTTEPPPTTTQPPPDPHPCDQACVDDFEARITSLENTVAQLDARLDQAADALGG